MFNRIKQSEFDLVRRDCSRFLREAHDLPLLKALPSGYTNFKKIKVRKKKSQINTPLNRVFRNTVGIDLYETTMFASKNTSINDTFNMDLFYVFPVDKYKFLYSLEVKNTSISYGTLLETLTEVMGSTSSEQVVSELIELNYVQDNLADGIKSGSEIVFFGIPKYYAVRCSVFNSYEKLLEELKWILILKNTCLVMVTP